MCGDSTKKGDVEWVMAGEKAALVLTDPPYGISQPGVPHDSPEEHGDLIRGAVGNLPMDEQVGAICISFQSPRTFPVWLDAIRDAGHDFKRMLWLYKQTQCGYPWQGWILKSESILVSSVGNATWRDVHPYAHDTYLRNEVSVRTEPEELRGGIPEGSWHGSVKPMEVVSDLMKRTSIEGDLIFDPFLGSGTTLIAAEQLGRRCYGLEISPQYCDVILARWETLTGNKAERVE